MRPRSNPPNPWARVHVEREHPEAWDPDWVGEPPADPLKVYEEDAKSLVVENDSPDVGFRFGVNPYRGCQHACAYCLDGATRILRPDLSTTPIADLGVGDWVVGVRRRGTYRRLARTRVVAHWRSERPAYRVRVAGGPTLIASADHRFLADRGWKYVTAGIAGRAPRSHLTPQHRLLGIGPFADGPAESVEYIRGYLCGMLRGDGLLRSYAYPDRRGRQVRRQHRFRLALPDEEALLRTRRFLSAQGIGTTWFRFAEAAGRRRAMQAIGTSRGADVDAIRGLIAWPPVATRDFRLGFLAGIFDAEGGRSAGILRITNTDPEVVGWISGSLRSLGFRSVVEIHRRRPRAIHVVRVLGGLVEHVRFFQRTRPAISRKLGILGTALKGIRPMRVAGVDDLGEVRSMWDITTGLGNFVAEGVVSHNCYARPSHQHLGFGAGTDFERRIVVKVNAPEVLRKELARPSWQGDELAFSGNTDCYQPLEASYRLTRRCLEACRDARNPVGIITKGVLVERDVALLAELHRVAGVRVHVSVPFLDPAVSRAMEPGPASPDRRFAAMKALADAGVPVGLSLAPVVPGLNDSDLPELLARAKAAGARTAFLTLLRLPAEVLPVFFERLEATLPLRVRKVRGQLLDVRGGRLHDARFGHRMEGAGPRWKAIVDLFALHCRRLGLNADEPPAGRAPTRGPRVPRDLLPRRGAAGQGLLFDADGPRAR